jgi:hypothetical protein
MDSLSAHDRKAYQTIQALKTNTLRVLEETIANLQQDIQERQDWLRKPSDTPPDLTRKFTSRQAQSVLTVETRLAATKRTKTLTLATKTLLKAVTTEAEDRMEELEQSMRSDYAVDLAEDPLYHNLSPTKLAKVEAEFETRLDKQLQYIRNELEQKRESIIRSQPTVRITATQQQPRDTQPDKRVIKFRNQQIEEYQLKLQQLNTGETEERAAFEETIAEYRQKGYTEKTIANAVKDLEEQLRKDRKRHVRQLDLELHMQLRLYQAMLLETDTTRLMEVYTDKAQHIVCLSKERFTWEEAMVIIDETFELVDKWEDFVSRALTVWSNIADSATLPNLAIQIELYARLHQSKQPTDTPQTDDLDYEIAQLQRQRDTLVQEVVQLNTQISKQIPPKKRKTKPKPVAVSSTRGPKRAPPTSELPVVMYTSSSSSIPTQPRCISTGQLSAAPSAFLVGVQQQLQTEMAEELLRNQRRLDESLAQQKEIDTFYDSYNQHKKRR